MNFSHIYVAGSTSQGAEPQTTDPLAAETSSPLSQRPETSGEKRHIPKNAEARLLRKVKRLQQKCRRMTNNKRSGQGEKTIQLIDKSRLVEELKEILPSATFSFVATQIRVAGKSKKQIRWTPGEKSLALSLLHSSPKAYRILQKVFSLPSISTLRRSMQKVQIYPGFNDNILQALQKKVSSMPTSGKACAVVFDEMSMKEGLSYNKEEDNIEGVEDFGNQRTAYAANHATVFMVRGLLEPWKQAVGYFLSSGAISGALLKPLLSKCLDKVHEIGLDVRAVICDQGSNNRKAIYGLGVDEDHPFITYKDKKIHVFFDPPHLLKNTRNNLKKTGFRMGDGEHARDIHWSFIEELYALDSENGIKLAPKLTAKHIKLPGFSALRVNLAAQVLSHSVASALAVLVRFGKLPAEALETSTQSKQLYWC